MGRKKKRIYLTDREKEVFIAVVKFVLFLSLAGFAVAFIAAMPNAILIAKLFITKNPNIARKYSEEEVEKVTQKVFKDHFVKIIEKDSKQFLAITNKGKRQLVEFDIDTVKIKKQKWDGRWRLVIFDVPEKFRLGRDVLRDKLREIGFVKLQKSVWVCPYECQNEISYIASVYEIEKYVNYAVVEKCDFSDPLRTIFMV